MITNNSTSNRTALVIHGAYGNPQDNWIPWLTTKLTGTGYEVITPHFPSPPHQSLDEWTKAVTPFLPQLNEQSIIIGHNIGATFVLRILELLKSPVTTAYLIAGFISNLGDAELNKINQTFYQHPFNWPAIKQAANQIEIIYSDNDPYVSIMHSQELAQALQVTPTLIPSAGHFNTAAGYIEFPWLLQKITQSV